MYTHYRKKIDLLSVVKSRREGRGDCTRAPQSIGVLVLLEKESTVLRKIPGWLLKLNLQKSFLYMGFSEAEIILLGLERCLSG